MELHETSTPAIPIHIDDGTHSPPGMTLRDWFAGQALAGMFASGKKGHCMMPQEISSEAYSYALRGPRWPGFSLQHQISNLAYSYADAMLAARAALDPSHDTQASTDGHIG
jgi:hypothetical protein